MPAKKIDLIGQKFGELTVVAPLKCDKFGQAMWSCQCSCGKKTAVRGSALRKGLVRSCGHIRYVSMQKRHRKLKDYGWKPGTAIGKLTLLKELGDGKWRCRCSCGKEVDYSREDLRRLKTCGCRNSGHFVGERFDSWEIVKRLDEKEYGYHVYEVKNTKTGEKKKMPSNLIWWFKRSGKK